MMIIVRLIGGLGNQLFQYAAALQIAHANHMELKLDIADFETYKLHAYSLHPFNIHEDFATSTEVAKLRPTGILLKIMQRIHHTWRPFSWRSWIVERHFQFDPRILHLKGSFYLDGFWQSEKYFKNIEHIIRQQIFVKTDPDPINAEMAQQIKTTRAVCLHIRRADYATNPVTIQTHGICSIEYYQIAADQLAAAVSNPHFFIFSDDMAWAQDNLRLAYPFTLVSHNKADRNYEDLRLMSLCQHFIIANSTFSWWGAWLANNPDKIVFAPARWFNDPTRDARDLVPPAWQRIS